MRINAAGQGIRRTQIGDGEVIDLNVCHWKGSGKVYVQYLYKDLIGMLAEDMRRNRENGFDNVVVVEGAEGSGKSNLMYQICKAFNPDFQISDGYIYDFAQLQEKLKKGDIAGRTLWMDEGSAIASNRDWQSEQNRNMVLFMETMRSKGIMFGMCIPHMERLDVYIRENRIRYLIKCAPMEFPETGYKERGYFELKYRTATKFKSLGYGQYDPMPPEIKEEYEARKLASQEDIIARLTGDKKEKGSGYKKKAEETERRQNIAMVRLYESGIDADTLMTAYGISCYSTFAGRIHRGRKAIEHGGAEDDQEQA